MQSSYIWNSRLKKKKNNKNIHELSFLLTSAF